jgi:subtilisin family serine protease
MPKKRLITKFVLTQAVLAAFFGVSTVQAAPRNPNDTYFYNQWYLQKIGAPEAWNHSIGFEGVTVAVIDSGVDINHPDLKGNIWRNTREVPGNGLDDDGNGYVDDVNGWDFVNGDNDPRPEMVANDNRLGAVHGTVSAGVIAAKGDNGQGVAGVTWQSTIMPLRALDANGQGDPTAVVQAVEYAVKNGAKVINLSLVGTVKDELLRIALRHAYDAGVFVVAAAGNAPDGAAAVNLDVSPRYPVCLDQESDENFVYGVAASDDQNRKADVSNYGAGCVDLTAPGTRFVGLRPYRPDVLGFSQPYGGYFSGTSIAAAVVSGGVALLRSMDPTLTPKQITYLLTESAAPINKYNLGYVDKLGRGLLDLDRATDVLLARQMKMQADAPKNSAISADLVSRHLVVAAPGAGRSADIRLFTEDGALVRSFAAFSGGFRGGVSLAAGNFDGMGRKAIVAGAGASGTPQVRIFDVNGGLLGSFLAYGTNFRGGVQVATGDFDGDKTDEIVTVPAEGGGSHVRIFNSRGEVKGGFFSFGTKAGNGWRVTAADFNDDGKAEIAVMPKDGSVVRVFNLQGKQLAEVTMAGSKAIRASSVLFTADGDGGGVLDLGFLRNETKGPAFSFFRINGTRAATYALTEKTIEGVGGWAVGSAKGTAPLVRLPNSRGNLVTFQAFENAFKGGVSAVRLD